MQTGPRCTGSRVTGRCPAVAARWAGLNRGAYDSTPALAAEAARGLVFDNFYAHIGRSSNSLGSILLSVFPKLDFSDLTEEYPRLPGTSIASDFKDRGYRTAFMTPSDLDWADWRAFLDGRGFGEVIDHNQLPCPTMLSDPSTVTSTHAAGGCTAWSLPPG